MTEITREELIAEIARLNTVLSATEGARASWQAHSRAMVAGVAKIQEERDRLLWLHAEAVHYGHGWNQQWLALRGEVRERTAERDKAIAALESLKAEMAPCEAAEAEWLQQHQEDQ